MIASGRGERMLITSKLEVELDLVRRHVEILKEVMKNQPIGIIKLSQTLNIPEHKIRYSLRILEQEKLIEPSPEGAKITKRAKRELKNIRESLERIVKEAEEIVKNIEEMEALF